MVSGWFALVLLGGEGIAAETLTRIAEVRSLTREVAATAVPVRVSGVVTWRSDSETFTIQDESAGIWISLDGARQRSVWRGDNLIFEKIREGVEVE
ncbi:MAG: hypothetical protein RLZZ214_739, partial [Verrucomicrobiota bacterium]